MEGFFIHLNDLIWLYFNFILKFNRKKHHDFRKINKGQLLIAEPSITEIYHLTDL
jgi:putative transcriptional regulator